MIAAAAMGDPNASIPTPQPVHYRPMFGSFAGGLRTSLTFVSQASLKNPALAALNLKKPLEAVRNTPSIQLRFSRVGADPQASRTRARLTKADILHNDGTPHIDVDPETYAVRADGELLVCEPAKVLPMAQRYFLF